MPAVSTKSNCKCLANSLDQTRERLSDGDLWEKLYFHSTSQLEKTNSHFIEPVLFMTSTAMVTTAVTMRIGIVILMFRSHATLHNRCLLYSTTTSQFSLPSLYFMPLMIGVNKNFHWTGGFSMTGIASCPTTIIIGTGIISTMFRSLSAMFPMRIMRASRQLTFVVWCSSSFMSMSVRWRGLRINKRIVSVYFREIIPTNFT